MLLPTGESVGTAVFTGLNNFRKMFDPTQWVVWSAVKNNLLWMVLMVTINITLAIVISGCLLNVSRRAGRYCGCCSSSRWCCPTRWFADMDVAL